MRTPIHVIQFLCNKDNVWCGAIRMHMYLVACAYVLGNRERWPHPAKSDNHTALYSAKLGRNQRMKFQLSIAAFHQDVPPPTGPNLARYMHDRIHHPLSSITLMNARLKLKTHLQSLVPIVSPVWYGAQRSARYRWSLIPMRYDSKGRREHNATY